MLINHANSKTNMTMDESVRKMKWVTTIDNFKSKIIAAKVARRKGKTTCGIEWLIKKGEDSAFIVNMPSQLAYTRHVVIELEEEIEKEYGYTLDVLYNSIGFVKDGKRFDIYFTTKHDNNTTWIRKAKYVVFDDADNMGMIDIYQHIKQTLILGTEPTSAFERVWTTEGGLSMDFIEVFQNHKFKMRRAEVESNIAALSFLRQEDKEWEKE